MNILTLEFKGQKFSFGGTDMAEALIREIFGDNYKVFERGIEFRPGDVVLDVGANEGMFSIMIAKLFPFVKVLSLEPVQRTFMTMCHNKRLNEVQNMECHNIGLRGKKPERELIVNKDGASGGSTALCTFNPEAHMKEPVQLVTLDQFHAKFFEDRWRLLKMDIEGMEYDVLYDSNCLDKADYFVGEFHINQRLVGQGRDINELLTYVGSKTKVIYVERCKMAE